LEINNKIYNDIGCGWWDENGNGNLVSLRYLTNPSKFNYINNVIKGHIRHSKKLSGLDVGCGGGYLSEKLAKDGLKVTGLDPSNNSIIAAMAHAKQENLAIKYVTDSEKNCHLNQIHFILCAAVMC
jgi:2-polyprenyl-6-hydroxyphenyl methylase/3-demethylubiquinone-9 3-methyltransferase